MTAISRPLAFLNGSDEIRTDFPIYQKDGVDVGYYDSYYDDDAAMIRHVSLRKNTFKKENKMERTYILHFKSGNKMITESAAIREALAPGERRR